MRKRSLRRLVGVVAMVGLLSAQQALASFACHFDGSGHPRTAIGVVADCHGPAQAPVPGALCDLHCQISATAPSAPSQDMAATPPPPLVVEAPRPQGFAPPDTSADLSGVALANAPPVAIRFCRLLI